MSVNVIGLTEGCKILFITANLTTGLYCLLILNASDVSHNGSNTQTFFEMTKRDGLNLLHVTVYKTYFELNIQSNAINTKLEVVYNF